MDDNTLSHSSMNSYINALINQIYSILPIYEENGCTKILQNKIDNTLYRLKGFFSMNTFDPIITTDILSFMSILRGSDNHTEIRHCVLKICSILSQLKVVTE